MATGPEVHAILIQDIRRGYGLVQEVFDRSAETITEMGVLCRGNGAVFWPLDGLSFLYGTGSRMIFLLCFFIKNSFILGQQVHTQQGGGCSENVCKNP